MRKGRVAAQGPTDEVLASGAVGDAFRYGHLAPTTARVLQNAARISKGAPKPSVATCCTPVAADGRREAPRPRGPRPGSPEARGPEIPRPGGPEASAASIDRRAHPMASA